MSFDKVDISSFLDQEILCFIYFTYAIEWVCCSSRIVFLNRLLVDIIVQIILGLTLYLYSNLNCVITRSEPGVSVYCDYFAAHAFNCCFWALSVILCFWNSTAKIILILSSFYNVVNLMFIFFVIPLLFQCYLFLQLRFWVDEAGCCFCEVRPFRSMFFSA